MEELPLSTTKPAFDQLPIGHGVKMDINQYPPGFDPNAIEAKKQPLPIAKRLASKVWKIKKQALDQLFKIVSTENHQQFTEHQPVIIKLLADSHAQVQFVSAKILLFYLQKQGNYNGQCDVLIKNVIEKLMIVDKEQVFNLGMEIIYWIIDHKGYQLVTKQLNLYILNKNPKIVIITMKVLQNLVNNYGIKKLLNLQEFSKSFKQLAQFPRPVAKPQSIQLFKEIYKWIGEHFFQLFSLHPQVKDDVSKWSKSYQMVPMEIKRGLKVGEEGKKINPMQQQEQQNIPVDVLNQFDSRWVDTVIQLQKWKQKKQMLQEFIKKTSVGSIVPKQSSHYITLIKRLFGDNNINLLQCGFKIVRNLCKGLKKAFSIPCKSFLPYVYIKLKDNKAMIVDETIKTLKVMAESIALQDMQQEIKAGLKDKSPQMRQNTLKLLKEFCSKKQVKTSKILKNMLDTLISLTNDSSSDVRDIALSVLCKIKEHYGILFFQDKLQTMPAKKVSQIKSVITVGGVQSKGEPMEIQEPKNINFQKGKKILQNQIGSKAQQFPQQNQNKTNKQIPNKKVQSHEEGQLNKNKQTEVKNVVTKRTSIIQEQQKQANRSMMMQPQKKTVHQSNNSHKEMADLQQIKNEEWPINPTAANVLRLINLFSQLGEPFFSLATPFKLNKTHFDIIQNCDNLFMISNADLILKWALWKILVEDPVNVQKIISVVIQLIYLLKTQMTDSQTLLSLSILSNALENNIRVNLLVHVNNMILGISESSRQKMFNFWIGMLQESAESPQFVGKILSLLTSTFQNFNFNNREIVTMARVEVIVNNKRFVDFLLTKTSKQFLKVSGFKFQDKQRQKTGGFYRNNYLLRLQGPQFIINTKPQEKALYTQIFRKTSQQAIDQLKKLKQSCAMGQIMGLHIKILDTIGLLYLSQKLQSINVYNYFKLLTSQICELCESQNGEQCITPYLRNLMRLLIFFLFDLGESKMDNKDELIKTVNKLILNLLASIAAEHLLQVLTMLLSYSIKKKLSHKFNQLLMKCITKAVRSISFTSKAQKNVKFVFHFFINFIQQNEFLEEQLLIKSIKSLFVELISSFKELCHEVIVERLNFYGGKLKNQQIQIMLNNFVGHLNNQEEKVQILNGGSTCSLSMNMAKNCGEVGQSLNRGEKMNENYQSMSNLSQTEKGEYKVQKINANIREPRGYILSSNTKIREATNTFSIKSQEALRAQKLIKQDSLIETNNREGNMRINPMQKYKIKAIQQLSQSLQQLQKMKSTAMPANPLQKMEERPCLDRPAMVIIQDSQGSKQMQI